MAAYVAHAEIVIAAPPETVWAVITDGGPHEEILAGARVVSEWNVGGEIRWQGEWKGEPFEDHGLVIEIDAPHRLVVTHYSPLTGLPDVPEHQHTLRYALEAVEGGTALSLDQDNNPTEEAAEHSAQNWRQMLDGVRVVAERAGD